jgi:putative addiction module killer protein
MAFDELEQQVETLLRCQIGVELIVGLIGGFKARENLRDAFHDAKSTRWKGSSPGGVSRLEPRLPQAQPSVGSKVERRALARVGFLHHDGAWSWPGVPMRGFGTGNGAAQARVLRFESGNLGDHKQVGDGVWEARLAFGPGYRIYFGKRGAELVLLLLGGDKGTQRKDIKQAKLYWATYVKETRHGSKK